MYGDHRSTIGRHLFPQGSQLPVWKQLAMGSAGNKRERKRERQRPRRMGEREQTWTAWEPYTGGIYGWDLSRVPLFSGELGDPTGRHD